MAGLGRWLKRLVCAPDVIVDLSEQRLVITAGDETVLDERIEDLVETPGGERQHALPPGLTAARLGELIRQAARAGSPVSRPRVFLTIDPEATLDDRQALYSKLGPSRLSELVFADRICACCAGIEEIRAAELRTAVACVLGERAFVGTYFSGSMVATRRTESVHDADALVQAATALRSQVIEFPVECFRALPRVRLERLRDRWGQGWERTVHLIVERDGFSAESWSLPPDHQLHVATPDRSFALQALTALVRTGSLTWLDAGG